MITANPTCPHCGSHLLRWANPEAASWDGEFQYVCFDDDCPYYKGGWEWMQKQFNVAVSYRYRLDPTTGQQGPLPVWSPQALRNQILIDAEEANPDVR